MLERFSLIVISGKLKFRSLTQPSKVLKKWSIYGQAELKTMSREYHHWLFIMLFRFFFLREDVARKNLFFSSPAETNFVKTIP